MFDRSDAGVRDVRQAELVQDGIGALDLDVLWDSLGKAELRGEYECFQDGRCRREHIGLVSVLTMSKTHLIDIANFDAFDILLEESDPPLDSACFTLASQDIHQGTLARSGRTEDTAETPCG